MMLLTRFYRPRLTPAECLFSTRNLARFMATVRSSLAHEDRTAAEPRENRLEPVVVADVQQINDSVRVFRLNASDSNHSIKFLPGQWIDTFIPGLSKAGGFTITSTPTEARPTKHSSAYLELAVQKSSNPPAQWLWQSEDKIIGSQLQVRVGGSFTWPSPLIHPSEINRLVLIAGGVGVNPLVSMFAHLVQSSSRPREIHFIYSTKIESDPDPQRILFLPRLIHLVAGAADPNVTLSLCLTKVSENQNLSGGKFPERTFARRLSKDDLLSALDGYSQQTAMDPSQRKGTVCYVCGPPDMTDSLVSLLSQQEGMTKERVLCEKWW